MPLMFAFVASALLHVAAVVGSGWVLPGPHEPDPAATTIDATIARAPARVEAAARSTPKAPAARPRTPSAPAQTAQTVPAAEPAPPTQAPAAEPEAASVAEPVPSAIESVARAPVKTALPGKGRVRYILTRGEGGLVIGQAIHSWEHDGLNYRLKNITETTGLAALFKPAQALQSSSGEVTEEGLRPMEFRQERSSVGIDIAQFDWQRRIVAYAGREEALVNGTQDILSMFYQLVLLAPRSGAVEMPIATGRRLGNYRWEVIGEETLTFPGGERRAVRIGTRSGNDNIELWLPLADAGTSRSLPLKIRFTDRKGEIYDQVVDETSLQEQQ